MTLVSELRLKRKLHQSVFYWLRCGLIYCCLPISVVLADTARFDQLVAQLDSGETVFFDQKTAKAFLDLLVQQLPADDPARLLRVQREMCNLNYADKPEQGIQFANQFINDPALRQDFQNLSYFYQCRADHYSAKGQLTEQNADLKQAIALAEKAEDKIALAHALSLQADVYSTRGQHADALDQLFKAYELFNQMQHKWGGSHSLENIAIAFRRMGEYSKALEYLEQSEKELNIGRDKYRLVFLLQQKAFVYGEMGNSSVARQLFHQVRQLYLELDETGYALATNTDLMWMANLEQKYSESLELAAEITKELQKRRQTDPDFQLFNNALFTLYYAEALSKSGRLREGLPMFEQARALIEPQQNPRYMLWLLRAWAEAEAEAKHYELAYQKLQQANQIQNEMNSLLKQQREALLRYQFDTDLQSQKNSQLQAENRLSEQQVKVLEDAQRWQYIAIGLFVVLAVIALFYAVSQIFRNRKLHRLAMTDELTQVGNRRSILWYANQVREKSAQSSLPWSVILVDIDHFKLCNDSYGHDAGDEVLVAVAQAMQSVLRLQDRLGRSGGEEFLLVLPDTSAHSAGEIANRLCSQVEALTFKAYPALQVTISLGVTHASRNEEIREVISRADSALYQAKTSGRNRVVVL